MRKTLRKSLLTTIGAILLAVLAAFFVACGKKKETYTLTFETDGGTQIAAITAEAGADITPPEDPEKAGFSFDGWYLNAEYSGAKQTIPSKMPENNVTYYAKFVEIQMATLTLDPTNNGTLEKTTYEIAVGTKLSEALKGITPHGKGDATFSCWYEGYQQLSDTKTMPKKGLTLTAKYEVEYTIDIYQQNTDGATYSAVSEESQTGKGLVGDTVDFSDDWDFKNAYANFSFNSSKSSAIELSVDKADNVYAAYYDRKKVSVTYVPNAPSDASEAATGTVSGESFMIGAQATITDEQFALAGYRFAGWSTTDTEAKPGDTLYKAGDTLEVGDMGLTLYAQWNYGMKDAYNSENGDIIYLLKETFDTATKTGTAVLVREGLGEKEITYSLNDKNRTEISFTTDDNTQITGRVSLDGKTFAYARTSEIFNVSLKLYDYASKETSSDVTLVLDGIDGATYTYKKDGASENTVVTGIYTPNGSNGYIFTPDEAFTGESPFAFRFGTLSDEDKTKVFQIRDKYYGLYSSSSATSEKPYPYVIFDGYGSAYKYTSSSAYTQGTYELIEGKDFYFNYEDSDGNKQRDLIRAGLGSSTQGTYYDCDSVKGVYTYQFNNKTVTLTLDGFGYAVYAVEGSASENTTYKLTATYALGDVKYAYVAYKTYVLRIDLSENGTNTGLIDSANRYGYIGEGAAKNSNGARLFLDGEGNATVYIYVTYTLSGYQFKRAEAFATGTYTIDNDGYYTLALTKYYAVGNYTAEEAEERFASYYNGVKIKLETVTTSEGTSETFATADGIGGKSYTFGMGENTYKFEFDGFGYLKAWGKKTSEDGEMQAVGTYTYSYLDAFSYTDGENSYVIVNAAGLYLRIKTNGTEEAERVYIFSDFMNRLSDETKAMIYTQNGTADILTLNSEKTAYTFKAGGTYTTKDTTNGIYTFTSGEAAPYNSFDFKLNTSLNAFHAYKEGEILTMAGETRQITDGFGVFNSRYYYNISGEWIKVYTVSNGSLSLGGTWKISGSEIVLPDDYANTYYSYELADGAVQFGVTGIVLDGYGTATYKTTSGDTTGTYVINEDKTITATFGENVITFKTGLRAASSSVYAVYIPANEEWKTSYKFGDSTLEVNEYGETTYTLTSGVVVRAYLVTSDDSLFTERKIAVMYVYNETETKLSYLRLVLTEKDGVKTLVQISATYGVYYLYKNDRMYTSAMLKYDGLGNVYYVTEKDSVKGKAEATENKNEYRFVPDDSSKEGFVYTVASISGGSTTYYVFLTYAEAYNAQFIAGDWSAVITDGYGNATLISRLGVKTSLSYRAITENVIFLYNSNGLVRYYFTLDKENGTFAETSEDFITDGDTVLAYTGTETEITLPSSATKIAGDAFYRNVYLVTVHLVNVTEIGDYAFYGCLLLKTIDLTNVMKIGTYAFGLCASLEEATIAKVTNLGGYAFASCTALKTAAIPAAITEIPVGAFYGCTALESVTGTENVTKVGAYAFGGCSALTSVTFGSALKEIGSYAFASCGSNDGLTFSLILGGESAPAIGSNAVKGSGKAGMWILVKDMATLKAYLKDADKLGSAYVYLGVQGEALGVYVKKDGENTTAALNLAKNSRAVLATASGTQTLFFYEVTAEGTVTLYAYSASAEEKYVTYTATISGNTLTVLIDGTNYTMTLLEEKAQA